MLFPNEQVCLEVHVNDRLDNEAFPANLTLKVMDRDECLPNMDIVISMNCKFPVPNDPVTYGDYGHVTADKSKAGRTIWLEPKNFIHDHTVSIRNSMYRSKVIKYGLEDLKHMKYDDQLMEKIRL